MDGSDGDEHKLCLYIELSYSSNENFQKNLQWLVNPVVQNSTKLINHNLIYAMYLTSF